MHPCDCGNGVRVQTKNFKEIKYPGMIQYEWHCDSCEKFGLGWTYTMFSKPKEFQSVKIINPQIKT